jgi:hypothetical protein
LILLPLVRRCINMLERGGIAMFRMTLAAIAAVMLASAAGAQTAPAGPAGCDTPESHQLDFWVGKWEVHPNGANKIIAHSLIEKKYTGCAVRENWMPLGQELKGGGGSLSSYDPQGKKWRQTWVDSTGARADFAGSLADGVVSITGIWPGFNGPGQDALVRMNYQAQPDGQVRQWGEASTDQGKTWKPAFDFLYRRIDEFPKF